MGISRTRRGEPRAGDVPPSPVLPAAVGTDVACWWHPRADRLRAMSPPDRLTAEEGRRRPVCLTPCAPRTHRRAATDEIQAAAGSLGPLGEVVVGRPSAGDQAPRAEAATWPGRAPAAERATEPRGTAARPGVGAGRVREDHPADGVAGGGPDGRHARRLAVPRPAGQRSGDVLDLPRRRAADGGCRRSARARSPSCSRRSRRPTRCSPPCSTSCGAVQDDARAGARRLPRHRGGRRPRRRRLPARAPPAADPPGHRHPRRPAAAAGPAARARRAGRGPRRRPALRAGRGGGVPRRRDGAAR